MSKADFKSEVLLNGSVVHWGECDPADPSRRRRKVACGRCGEDRFARPFAQSKSHPRWSGFCTRCSYASGRKHGDELHASGTIIHWNERDPEAPAERTKITCHYCGRNVFDSIKGIRGPRWSGRCFECRQTAARTGDESLPSGSIIHWGETDSAHPRARGVTCGRCGERRVVIIPSGVKLEKFSGFCEKCAGMTRRQSGDERHSSGTIIHWNERDRDDPYYQILVTCHNCGHDRFVHKGALKNPSWHGLCPDCLEKYGLPRERRTLKGQHRNRFGALIDYDAPHGPNRALVYCPNFSTCGGKEDKRVDLSNQDKQPFYCRACLSEDKRKRLGAAWAAVLSGGVSARRRRPRFDRDKFLRQLNKLIVAAWDESKPKIPSRQAVANKFALRGLKPATGAGVKQRLALSGRTEEWEIYARGYS